MRIAAMLAAILIFSLRQPNLRAGDPQWDPGETRPSADVDHPVPRARGECEQAAQGVQEMLDLNLFGVGDSGQVDPLVPILQLGSIRLEGLDLGR